MTIDAASIAKAVGAYQSPRRSRTARPRAFEIRSAGHTHRVQAPVCSADSAEMTWSYDGYYWHCQSCGHIAQPSEVAVLARIA